MAHRLPQLTPKLPNGTYRILSPHWMRAFFSRHIPIWYPKTTLRALRIAYKRPIDFKLNVRYDVTLENREGKRERRTIRANIPSRHTTHELATAFRSTQVIWNDSRLRRFGTTTRPLALRQDLRAFFYEAADGVPLLSFLKQEEARSPYWMAKAGQWLHALHALKRTFGRRLSLAQELRNVHYFALNYSGYGTFIKRYHPSVLPVLARAHELLASYRAARRRLEPVLKRHATLNHGDFHPSNILLDGKSEKLSFIDFGNAMVADPYSDVANTLVQLDLLPLNEGVPRRLIERTKQEFFRAYTGGRALTMQERQRFSLFLLRWSLQTLSYTLALIAKYDKRPILYRSVKRAEQAFTDL